MDCIFYIHVLNLISFFLFSILPCILCVCGGPSILLYVHQTCSFSLLFHLSSHSGLPNFLPFPLPTNKTPINSLFCWSLSISLGSDISGPYLIWPSSTGLLPTMAQVICSSSSSSRRALISPNHYQCLVLSNFKFFSRLPCVK